MEKLKIGDMITIEWKYYQFFNRFMLSSRTDKCGYNYFLVSKVTKKYYYFEEFSASGFFNNRTVKLKVPIDDFHEISASLPDFHAVLEQDVRDRILVRAFEETYKTLEAENLSYLQKSLNALIRLITDLNIYHPDLAKAILVY